MRTWDKWAIVSNLLCLVHCLFLPVIPLIAPFSVVLFYSNPFLHMGLGLFSVGISVGTWLKSYRTHRSYWPFFFLGVGYLITFLFVFQVTTAVDVRFLLLTSTGFVLFGIFLNIKFLRKASEAE